MSKLAIEGVSKNFAQTKALERIDLAIADNDFLCILGPSGCGKSTLLRIVAGLEAPSTGRVLLDGQAVERPGPDRGMVFQSYTLFPWLTVRQNVLFGARARESVADELILRVGLKGFAKAAQDLIVFMLVFLGQDHECCGGQAMLEGVETAALFAGFRAGSTFAAVAMVGQALSF